MDLGTQFNILNKRVEVLAKNLGRLNHRHLRIDRTVGPNLKRQLIVVGLLANTSFFDVIPNASHRAVNRVDRNDTDLVIATTVLAGRNVAATIFDNHLHHEWDVFGQSRQRVIRVDDVNFTTSLNIVTGDRPSGAFLDRDDFHLIGVILDDQVT